MEQIAAVRQRVLTCLEAATLELLALESELRGHPLRLHDGVDCGDIAASEARRLNQLVQTMAAPLWSADEGGARPSIQSELAPDARLPESARLQPRCNKVCTHHPTSRHRPYHRMRPSAFRYCTCRATPRPSLRQLCREIRRCPQASSICKLPVRPRMRCARSPVSIVGARAERFHPRSQAAVDTLRQQLATLDKQNKRLASVFKGKIEEFRKVRCRRLCKSAMRYVCRHQRRVRRRCRR